MTTRAIAYPPAVSHSDVVETAIEAARELNFPPATKIDKATGLVEFGGFERSMIGITAQVRVKSEGQLEVTVKRGSDIYHSGGPLTVDQAGDQFKEKIAARLEKAGK